MIPEELTQDLQTLQNQGFNYELVEESSNIYIVFKSFPLPPALYNMEATDLLIFTTIHYPSAGFDMFWTDLSLTLNNGDTPKNADTTEQHLDRKWRRFSYHPYDSKPWKPHEDNVIIFIEYVRQRLRNGD